MSDPTRRFDIKPAEPLAPALQNTTEANSNDADTAFTDFCNQLIETLYQGRTVGIVLFSNTEETFAALPREFHTSLPRASSYPEQMVYLSHIADVYGPDNLLAFMQMVIELQASGYAVTKHSGHRVQKRMMENFTQHVSFLHISRPLT